MTQKIITTTILTLMIIVVYAQNSNLKLSKSTEFSDLHKRFGNQHINTYNSLNSVNQCFNEEEKEKFDSIVVKNWDASLGYMVDNSRLICKYSKNNLPETVIAYKWSVDKNSWQNVFSFEYFYNEDNINIKTTYNEYDNEGKIKEQGKIDYLYDSNNVILQTVYLWDVTNEKWIENSKIEYVYDINNNLTSEISHKKNELDEWYIIKKTENVYNSLNYIVLSTNYMWDDVEKNTIKNSKYEYSYTEKNSLEREVRYKWDKVNEIFVPSSSIDYKFVIIHLEGSYQEITSHWNNVTEQWVNYQKIKYTLDSNGNREAVIEYSWDYTNSNWIYTSKKEYVYDNTILNNEILLPKNLNLETYSNKDKVLNISQFKWSQTTDDWNFDNRTYFYYSKIEKTEIPNTEIRQIADNKAFISPNPVFTDFRIKGVEERCFSIELFDLQGKTILTKQISDNEFINVSTLNSGVYIYKIGTKNFIQNGKLVKE